jgi:hypothetical protein
LVADGWRWMVGMDLKKFFAHLNHDVLMSRVTRKVKNREDCKNLP